MIYPHNFEAKIGFDMIREQIKSLCVSEMGKEYVGNIQYSTDFYALTVALEETFQFQQMLLFDTAFPAQDFHDVRPLLKNIRLEGSFLEVDELAQVRGMLQAIVQTVVFFRVKNDDEKYPRLWHLCKDILLEKNLLESINKIIDPKGQLRDNASEELRRIKREIIKISGEADRKIRKLLTIAKQDGLVKEDAEMTIRNGRLCIPVPAQFKRRLQGFIHDESATGQTVFIEPTEVFDANNELKDLLNAERREIIRILTEIANEIRLSIPNILIGVDFLGVIDFIRAKAMFAININATLPHLFDTQIMDWKNAIHPILFLTFQKERLGNKKVVPLDIHLNKEKRILIISGPNAGGKSVCLKTIGLLQYMMQCGLLVPLDSTSDMGIFTSFFIALGDEQSIENDLSTYSSHLKNLNVMLQHLNEASLFLIDEFGSGTEPTLGGAMAESILEELYQKEAFGIITTHYGNLKLFCDTHPAAENGAMLFDTAQMKPLFKLRQGKPGSSFTYEIARQIGLPEMIIADAISKSGTAQIDYERKLDEIEVEKLEIDNMLKRVTQTDEKLAEMIANYSVKFSEFEKQRKDILQNAKNQAISIIENANRVIENTIREIKEAKADAEKTKTIRKEVFQHKEKIEKEVNNIEKEKVIVPVVPLRQEAAKLQYEPLDPKIQVGDAVFINDIQTIGEVVQLQGEDITVSFNSISFKTHIDKVTKISKREARSAKRGAAKLDGTRIGDILNEKVAKFSPKIDVRGLRAEEALQTLEAYIDEAVLLGIHQVSILHGKGNGILRMVVRQFLNKRPEVAKFYDDAVERGGAGITIVEIR
ncbi:MAG: Smr/MutS family protein [Bacteroidetes bacterium]|nr:Smr/MutS family protein [Bacteroidota bacterium]